MKVQWIDSGREPTQPPNPNYPHGLDVDVSDGKAKTCSVSLPYPAKRCGAYYLECETCGITCLVTTAGRIDDPRSVKVACRATA